MAARASWQNTLRKWRLSRKRPPPRSYAGEYPHCRWRAGTMNGRDDASSCRSDAPFHLLCRSGSPAVRERQESVMACRLRGADLHRALQLPVLSRNDSRRSRQPSVMIPRAASESMPVGVDNARRLANFCSDEPKLLLGKSENVHLNMQGVVGSALGDDAPGQDIEVLKAFQDASNGPRVVIRDDAQAP